MTAERVQQNAFRVLLDTWLDRLGRIIAWVGLVFWAVIAVAGFVMLFGESTHDNSADYYMPFVCFGLAALNGWALLSIRRRHALLSDFRRYCAVFVREPGKSIPDLAATLGVSEETVMRQLEKMCRRRYFNGYIDHSRSCMVFAGRQNETAPDVVYCSGCGARNLVSQTGDACRYCGAPLKKSSANLT
jgi:hypothetical protein